MSSHPLPVDSDPSNPDWQIEDLLDEIARDSKSALPAGEFYRLVLDRIVPAIGAAGGAIWTSARAGELCLEYQVNLAPAKTAASDELLASHQQLVEDVLRTGQARVAPPGSGESPGDRTDGWLIVYPFQAALRTTGAIELVERREMTTVQGRGYLRLLAAVVELTEDFHRNRELGELRLHAQSWREYEQFTERVHRSLDLDETAFLVANDGRRIIGCDRVSVLVGSSAKWRATAISGVGVLDRRAEIVRKLEHLAARSVATGEAVWYSDGATDLADEIERPLQAYLEESHARAVAIVPLSKPQSESDDRPPRIVGVLVAERFQAAGSDAELRERVSAVAIHSAVALNNAITHSRLPLSSVGRALAKVRWLTEARQLPKTAIALAAVAVVGAALAIVPADFDIETRGELQPAGRRDVFASDDGGVDQLLVDHAQRVHGGEALIVLRKPELDLEFRRLAGEMQTAEKKLAAVQAERLENVRSTPEARRNVHQLTADEEELKEMLKGLRDERAILERQRSDLVVRSPIDGQALTWNLKQLLEARPVQRGQTLLTVADLDGPWVAELHLADNRAGHVLAAQQDLRRDLQVSFALSAEPGTVYEGRVADAALSTELDEETGPTILVTVDFDRTVVAGLRPGATVIARIHCGRRAIGYVWLHDLFEFVQSHWWW